MDGAGRPFLCRGPYIGEISALSFFPLPSHLSSLPLLLAGSLFLTFLLTCHLFLLIPLDIGTGSALLLYNLEIGILLHSSYVFDGVRVHGISVRSYSDPLIAVFGEKKVKLFTVLVDPNPLHARIEFVIQLPRFEHWVLDVKFMKNDGYLALGLSDNSVALWDVDNSTLAARFKYAERCLLYSMRIWGESLESLQLASGTIYNEVIVWRLKCQNLLVSSFKSINKCTNHDEGTQSGHQQILPVHLSRLFGHEGSISRIAWSNDGSKLISVSDDRSARIWMSYSNGLNYCDAEDKLGSLASNKLVLFGHSARIWDCHISDSLIITAGEDCTCRVWDLDGNLILIFKEHIGRGIWRCLFDESSSLLVTAGFDSAIKVHRVCFPSARELTRDDRLLNDVKVERETFAIAAPQVKRHQGPVDSKSEYVRCLCFAQENVLYVATNSGLLYHVELCKAGAVKWTQLAQVSKESPIICMDLMSLKSCSSSLFLEYAIAIGDGLGNATVMKLIGGKSTFSIASSFAWTAEKKRQLLGIFWCKSLYCHHIFTVDPSGTIKLWKINNALDTGINENNLKRWVSLIAEFTSYFGARIMCLHAAVKEEVLVCGDQRGNLTIYPLSEDTMRADSGEMVKRISIINRFKGAHGISNVTSLNVSMLGFNQVEIRTTGGDGCICYFKYDKSLEVLEFVGMKRLKELSTVQSVIQSPMGEYALGFTSADFIMWNLAIETKMSEISCGGWRRPYSYHLGPAPNFQFCFAFVKDLNIHIHRWCVPAHERQQHMRVLHLQYHGREIHTLCFISFSLQSNPAKLCDRFIATGCEDGTVRLTRCTPLGRESCYDSTLLGEHIGGSAVRSICFTSKIFLIGSDQTCCTWNDVLDCNKHEPLLLISAGTKQVLTSWILQYQSVDVNEKSVNVRESEDICYSSGCKRIPITFQWLATDSPSKYANQLRRVETLPEIRNASAAISGAKSEASIGESKEESSQSEAVNLHENDWRYLAVTAFLVKHVDSKFTTCFIVVACSDGTLSLKALLLPFRLWFVVALLVPESSPVLVLKHVAIPLCTGAYGNISTGYAHIVLSGSTDGAISFWDLTEVIENFMQLVLEYQPQMLVDCQGRPRTGRGSQGGRWWKHLQGQSGDTKMRCPLSKNKFGHCTSSTSSENIVPNSMGQGSHHMRDQLDNYHPGSSDSFSSPDGYCRTPFATQKLLPLHVLTSVHQSGVNCLHVSEMRESNDKLGRVYCVVSGGDDQAVHCIFFQVGATMKNLVSSCSQTANSTKHMQNADHSQSSGSSFIEKRSFNNISNFYHLTILQKQSVNSAHSSSVKGIWTDGIWIFSTGLDQRIRCWQIGFSKRLVERAHLITSVPEPESLDVLAPSDDRKIYQIAVAGRGMQIIDFFAPSGEDL